MKGPNGPGQMSILDIRERELSSSLLDQIREKLRPGEGDEKQLPTLLLYDERGLKLFEDITYLPEYYLTNAEIEVLETHADRIAQVVLSGSQIIELGSGNLRKVNILLRALERAEKTVDYYALDLSRPELERTLAAIPDEYRFVTCHGLHGTYDDGLAWLKLRKNAGKPRIIMSLGSSIGNFTPPDAASFLRGFMEVLGSHGRMLIGLDACQDPQKIYHAYNDREGTTHEFYRNGLAHANRIVKGDVFRPNRWAVRGEYDETASRHQAFFTPLADVTIEEVHVRAGERIRFEESYKYSRARSDELWRHAGLATRTLFTNEAQDYCLHLLERPTPPFPRQVESYAAQPVPSLAEFQQLWATWDTITRQMIPEEEWLAKPIRLRHCCLFYFGHIPAFLDIHVSDAVRKPLTPPEFFPQIFERGIDPDVDDPRNCHAHSAIPETWPAAAEVFAYQDRVRNRVNSLYAGGTVESNRGLGHALWLSFEHTAMHLETLLYMLLQSDKALPPLGPIPDFKSLAEHARQEAVPNEWITIPPRTISLGLDDPETDAGPDRYFGWDNEKPRRQVKVKGFEANARALTNEDYARFLHQTDRRDAPATWVISDESGEEVSPEGGLDRTVNGTRPYMNGNSERLTDAYLQGKSIRTVYGVIPLKYTLDWPVMASYDELSACARWMGGRIPTVEEAHSIYEYADLVRTEEADGVQARTISAVNGHLSNNGVEESPPSPRYRKTGSNAVLPPNPHRVFANLDGCNVGFHHFHPTPVTQHGHKLAGRGEMGGVWEWTSTVLEKHEGFQPMKSYPGYTADFFDGKHNVMLGGSWATHPRIAGRKTFVNWFQRNYPFTWAGVRLVRDMTPAS